MRSCPPRWRPGPRRSASGRSPWTPPRPSRWPSSPAPSSRSAGSSRPRRWPGPGTAPWGAIRVLAGVAFSVGLVLVVVGGAELFTGNNLIVMAWASRRVSTWALLRNWLIVFAGNFVGAGGTAALVYLAGTHRGGSGAFGVTALAIAHAKVELGFTQADRARRPLQYSRLPGRLADPLRPHDRRPHPGHRSADQRLRGRRVRAFRRQHVLRPARSARHHPRPGFVAAAGGAGTVRSRRSRGSGSSAAICFRSRSAT